MKYPEDFINKIICGDCIDIMKYIPNESIDLILTDPPYGIKKGKIIGDESVDVFKRSIKESYRVLRDNTFYLTFCGAGQFKEILCDNPFNYRWQCLLYINNGMVRGSMGFSLYQPVLVFMKGDAKIKKQIPDVMEISTSSKACAKRCHPYEKYVPFIEKLIRATSKENDIVLDPFIGAGSTAMACKNLNRNFIGIDIVEEYCKIAEKRIKDLVDKR